MATTANLFQRFGTKWLPDADSVNAPEDALLRADNLVPDKIGRLALRRGSEKAYSGLVGGSLHSIHTVELADSNTYRAAGVRDTLYINGVSQGAFDGSGDIAMGDDSYQMFFARGTTKKKWDGTNWNNWGVLAPIAAPTLAAVASLSTTVAAFNNSESPAVTIEEGGGIVGGATDQGRAANEATTITPDGATNRAVVQRLFTTDQNFFEISGVEGSETDLIDLYVNLGNPRNTETIQLIFGADNSSTAPFTTDRFEFTFDLRSKKEIPLKDFESEGYSAYEQAVLSSLEAVRAQDVTGIKTPERVKQILASVGKIPSPTSAAPSDANVWGHLTVTRGQFTRVGSTAGRGWDTIRGFKVIYTTKAGTTPTLTLADAIVVGGGDRTLTGSYRCVIQAVRDFDGQYFELSPPSAQTEPINLNHQTLQITIPGTTLSALDEQADQIWVYLFGGWLDQYYRFAIVPSTIRGGMTIDELTSPAGSDLDSADERARITTWGFTMLSGGGSSDLVFTLDTSEMQALTEDKRLDPFLSNPPDNIVDIAGPWNGRMFALTSDGFVYPSLINVPSTFNTSQIIDLTRYGDPKWIAKTGQRITVGMEKDVVFLRGTGDDSVDLGSIDLFGTPLNVGNPPVDACHWVDGNAIVYRSADGLMIMTGASIQPVPMSGTSLLWRGTSRHGVSRLNVVGGRFRCAVDDAMLYILAPEGASVADNSIYRFSSALRAWSRLVYDQVVAFHSLFKEPDGSLVAGDSSGNFWVLDTGTQDDGQAVIVNALTPIRDGGNPLARKDAFGFQIHVNTGGGTGTLSLYKNGDTDATSSYSFGTTQPSVYRINASDFGRFLKAQIGFTGSFTLFDLSYFNLAYRPRPQHVMHLDTGYIMPDEPGRMAWLFEVELDADAVDDVVCKIYVDDTLRQTATITVTPDIRKTYIVPVDRGIKGLRPRVVLETVADNAAGAAVGFEPYGVRLRMSSTGNQEGSAYRRVFPVETAP